MWQIRWKKRPWLRCTGIESFCQRDHVYFMIVSDFFFFNLNTSLLGKLLYQMSKPSGSYTFEDFHLYIEYLQFASNILRNKELSLQLWSIGDFLHNEFTKNNENISKLLKNESLDQVLVKSTLRQEFVGFFEKYEKMAYFLENKNFLVNNDPNHPMQLEWDSLLDTVAEKKTSFIDAFLGASEQLQRELWTIASNRV
jgi:hypothetical protein